ncbi:MAG: hypothetical protein ACJAS9_003822 [Polaribacter sp.]
MEIRSLQSEGNHESLSELLQVSGAVRNIIAISAYIDIESISQLIDFLKSRADSRGKASLKIFIDKSSSRFFSNRETKRNLLEKQRKIQYLFSGDSGIFLVQFGKLFHSKVYLIEGNKNGKILLGSMNLTQKGVNDNEEILLIDDYHIDGRAISNRLSNWVKDYSGTLLTKSTAIDDNLTGNYPSCMRQFLLDGKVYYELKEQNPFRFKLCLPDNIIKQRAAIDPLLESSITDTVSLETLITEQSIGLGKKIPNLGKSRAPWKKHCVETCYGFWNPDLRNEELVATLENRIKQRKPHYDAIENILNESDRDIRDSFLRLCERIQKYLVSLDIIDWKYGNPEKAEESWRKWYEALLTKLKNKEFYNRLISGISSVPSPDVWSDPISSTEFEDSFYESIIYHWSKEYSKETTNVIAQAVAWNLDLDDAEKDEMDLMQLKKAMELWFKKNLSSNIVEFNEEE